MQEWVEKELKYLDLGDKRLNRRLKFSIDLLSQNPTASVPEACGDWAATKGLYRFWENPSVKAESIINAHSKKTLDRIKEHSLVLTIQDTTDLDFTAHPSTKGLGYLDSPLLSGLKVHHSMAVSSDGVPLGLLRQQVWTRDIKELGKKHKRHQKDIKDKESYRWLESFKATQNLIPSDITQITIADREADIFEFFALPRRPNDHLLIRATHNRRIKHPDKYLWDAIRKTEIKGKRIIKVERRKGQRQRKAELSVRFATFTLLPPDYLKNKHEPIEVQVILAEEENPPEGVKAISWLLITTLPVNSFEDAIQCIIWYTYRWLIERYHYVLKSGCKLEELQLETGERLQRALATYSIVAWYLLWLIYESRVNPNRQCDTVLEEDEWKVLCIEMHNKGILKEIPNKPPSLQEAVRWIAMLGGFLGRKSDGNPGVKTLWRGYRRLQEKVAFLRALKNLGIL